MHKKTIRGRRGRAIYAGVFVCAFAVLAAATWRADIFSSAFGADRTPVNESGVCPLSFAVEETLMLPTTRGVSLIMVPKESASLFIEYGDSATNLSRKTPRQTVSGGETAKFTINDLRPGQTYTYRVQCRHANSAEAFTPRPEHTFTTLQKENQTFSFGYATDAHVYPDWTEAVFESKPNNVGLKNFKQSIENIHAADLDFVVIGGDFLITQGCAECAGGVLDGVTYEAGGATSIEQSALRYRTVFSPELFGKGTTDTPFVYVLGNHEGEIGFINGIPPTCTTDYASLKAMNMAARLGFFINPHSIYKGDPEGRYYAFETGDALIAIVEARAYTTEHPKTADDWTLGAEQRTWLERVLKNSNKKWKFIFAEHLIGGEPTPNDYFPISSPGPCDAGNYGRGGLRATDNNKPNGVFLGEQALIQSWMEEYNAPGGATFFLSGHDHLAIMPTEKPNMDGSGTDTYMVKGGQIGAKAPPWAVSPSFKKEMDWDLDGVADYDSDTVGTKKRGYFKITVQGKESVTFDYILSTPENTALNNTVFLSKTIYAK